MNMQDVSSYGLLIVDMQGKLARSVHGSDDLVQKIRTLIRCCQFLSIPVVGVEQNPNGLGPTLPEIMDLCPNEPFISKFHFDALSDESVQQAVRSKGKSNWLVVGIEAHICIYQTSLGLLRQGYGVDVVSDCISSRNPEHIRGSLENLRVQGGHISNVEMSVYGFMKSSHSPVFRDILKVIK